MRKLKLQIEDLEVVSFETDLQDAARGTVAGHKLPPPTQEVTCVEQLTCDVQYATCGNGATCWHSCQGICGSAHTECAICLLY